MPSIFARTASLVLLASILLAVGPGHAAAVAVHDPSIVIVYKDAGGNSFPENDAGKTRSKHYYVFGTMLGAAHSTDMINWTSFTPTLQLNGAVSTDYYGIFKAEGDYAKHVTSDELLGNLWAPDVLYNKSLKKWAMYISLSGVDFKSSVVMLVSDKVEGPYKKTGVVVYGGFTNNETSVGRTDYQSVTSSSTVDARYLKSGAWNNDYSVSAIDPSVLYDQQGRLWMTYGSWSGGIFLLKLDEATGLRDRSWNYGFGTSPSWNGTTLRWDPYMGLHIGGGWYVSGEGPYIRYLQDPEGKNGYYYLFVSMGFYSPEGGYTMRVFRSPTIDGSYTDVSGDNAAFSKWVFNYGSNVQYGFPIVQNHKWSWWANAEIAQGHNSVLRDEDGKAYLVYHRKFDNGTAWHNVETHELLFNDQGWILAAPFEHRAGWGLRKGPHPLDEIAGTWGTIAHDPVDYATLKSNTEKDLRLNADGTVGGAFTGTWSYAFSNGRQFLTLTTTAGTFRGVLAEQLTNDQSASTIAFTAMNPANERALWGYRKPTTARSRTTLVHDRSVKIGAADTTLAWDAYDRFLKDTASGDFEAEYHFQQASKGVENWHNWAVILQNGAQSWHLRGDAWSLSTFPGSVTTTKLDWNGAPDWKNVFRNRNVRVKVAKSGSAVDVFAWSDTTLVFTASAVGVPVTGIYTMYLGGEAVLLDVGQRTVRAVGSRQLVGKVNDDGTYTNGFNTAFGDTTTVGGDFRLVYRFTNHHNPTSTDNWDHWILREISGANTMLIRADAFAMDPIGTVAFTYDWDWAEFQSVLSGAHVEMAIRRVGTIVTCSTTIVARDGRMRRSVATQTNAPTTPLSFGFTNEESMVDLLETERVTEIGKSGGSVGVGPGRSSAQAPRIRAGVRSIVIEANRAGEITIVRPDGRVAQRISFAAGTTRSAPLEPGIYLVAGRRVMVP
jgi:beta-xylosidase